MSVAGYGHFGSGDAWIKTIRAQAKSGDFWANRKFGGDHLGRLKNAMENLPLPAAFREAMIALRAIIRQLRKEKAGWLEEIKLLYWLAAIDSFSKPYSERLQEPGFNVLVSIPWDRLSALEFTYDQLGYSQLGLLKADIKWLQECFGEPTRHTNLLDMYPGLWREHEDKLIVERQQRAQQLRQLLR